MLVWMWVCMFGCECSDKYGCKCVNVNVPVSASVRMCVRMRVNARDCDKGVGVRLVDVRVRGGIGL